MLIRWLIATLHPLALPLGLGSIAVRATAVRRITDTVSLARVFRADSDTSRATAYARLSAIQGGLVVLMVFGATAMARGWFH